VYLGAAVHSTCQTISRFVHSTQPGQDVEYYQTLVAQCAGDQRLKLLLHR
jgi:hypothetical protein